MTDDIKDKKEAPSAPKPAIKPMKSFGGAKPVFNSKAVAPKGNLPKSSAPRRSGGGKRGT